MTAPDSSPAARVETVHPRRLTWWFPVLALALTVYLGAEYWLHRGPLLTIHTEQGHSLGVGDALKYRGVTLGIVESIQLNPELDSVRLHVRLEPDAEPLCREGSRFWVVHPELGLDHVRGLETIVGARYITVDPGDPDMSARFEFKALAEAPAQEGIEAGSLNLRLLAMQKGNLSRGAKVTFRGVNVGTVLGTRLTSDGTGVEIEATIRPAYVGLVRETSRFWRTGGFEVKLGLAGGLSVELDSLRSLVVGGVAFATPEQPGGPLGEEARFDLYDKPEKDWATWRPSLTIGVEGGAAQSKGSSLVHAVLTYEAGRLFSSEEKERGWVIALPGAVLGPQRLLLPPEAAKEGSALLEVGGVQVSLDGEPSWSGLGLVRRAAELPGFQVLGREEVSFGPALQDCIVRGVGKGASLSISSSRLSAVEDGWRVDEDIDLFAVQSGLLVYGLQDRKLVGVLLKEDDEVRIALFQAEQW